jgi:hypothetical protein
MPCKESTNEPVRRPVPRSRPTQCVRIEYYWCSPAPQLACRLFRRAGDPVNSRPPVKPTTTVEPFKHVIDEYKHQAQTITCTCGWHGSSATLDRGGSEWTAHLFEVRGKKR